MLLLEDTAVEIICPRCRNQHSKTLRWLRDHSNLTCSSCGFEIALTNEQLRASIDEFAHTMRGLKQSVDKHRPMQ
jgi:transcription elongation factor Elf1